MKKPKSPTKPSNTPANPSKRLYTVKLAKTAQKQLDKLPNEVVERLNSGIAQLAFDPRPSGVKKLKSREGYRIRVGDYRILYSIFDSILLIEVVKVGQRGNFYDE